MNRRIQTNKSPVPSSSSLSSSSSAQSTSPWVSNWDDELSIVCAILRGKGKSEKIDNIQPAEHKAQPCVPKVPPLPTMIMMTSFIESTDRLERPRETLDIQSDKQQEMILKGILSSSSTSSSNSSNTHMTSSSSRSYSHSRSRSRSRSTSPSSPLASPARGIPMPAGKNRVKVTRVRSSPPGQSHGWTTRILPLNNVERAAAIKRDDNYNNPFLKEKSYTQDQELPLSGRREVDALVSPRSYTRPSIRPRINSGRHREKKKKTMMKKQKDAHKDNNHNDITRIGQQEHITSSQSLSYSPPVTFLSASPSSSISPHSHDISYC